MGILEGESERGFPCGSAGKESAHNVGDLGSIPVLGRFPGGGKGYPLQYSGLNPAQYSGLNSYSNISGQKEGKKKEEEICN